MLHYIVTCRIRLYYTVISVKYSKQSRILLGSEGLILKENCETTHIREMELKDKEETEKNKTTLKEFESVEEAILSLDPERPSI